ncbi:MAG: DUF4159 domain-containing protein [Rhodospirillales bacterium]
MLSLGPLTFLVPWALAAAAALPVLWWLLRLTPPAPERIEFPPMRLFLNLTLKDESLAKSPPWLLILRLLLAVAVIVGAAHPLLNATSALRGEGTLILVIDDGWAAAANWRGRQAVLSGLIDQAERQRRAVAIVTTAAAESGAIGMPVEMRSAGEARRFLETLQPKPWPTDRRAALAPLVGGGRIALGRPGHVVWLSDGLDEGNMLARLQSLRPLGTITVISDPPPRLPKVLRPPISAGQALRLRATRASAAGPALVWVRALNKDGQLLAREAIRFEPGERQAQAPLILPAELRNRLTRLEIDGETTAASVVLVDERWRRRPVGLVSGEGATADQPLLSGLYYLERALQPFTEVRRGGILELLSRQLAVLVLDDVGEFEASERRRLRRWMEDGGVVLRFAGRRLAGDAGDAESLLPVRLRSGGRAMGGTMSWAKPAALATFSDGGPFHGLEVPDDIQVSRQVLAQPSVDLAAKTWARLSDGTSLVTADKRGKGWLVLVHTTANTTWSNLPLSGLFVEMLRRLVGLSQGLVARAGGAPLSPLVQLDGFGRLKPASASALTIAAEAFDKTMAGPRHPPGIYASEQARRALNLSAGIAPPKLAGSLPNGVSSLSYGKSPELDFRPWLFGLAFLLVVIDLAASLALRGFLRFHTAVLALLVLASPAAADKADDFALAASLQTRLAYVITGDRQADEVSRAGLTGLGVIVRRRTAAELGPPLGVDLDNDELNFFPLLYWPLTPAQRPLTAAAAARVNAYMLNGGTILFDTRERSGAARIGKVRQLADALVIPPLVPVPPNHVLARSFYLLRDFPGRWTGATVWIEKSGGLINDGVSPVIVGGHDWAAAWAMDETQKPLFHAVPGGERQREMAYRFGINLVMYTLTGNYKSDQVHLPAILKRLGQ